MLQDEQNDDDMLRNVSSLRCMTEPSTAAPRLLAYDNMQQGCLDIAHEALDDSAFGVVYVPLLAHTPRLAHPPRQCQCPTMLRPAGRMQHTVKT